MASFMVINDNVNWIEKENELVRLFDGDCER